MIERIEGHWMARIGEHPFELAMRLNFDAGRVLRFTVPVGCYEENAGWVFARIGEQCRLELTCERKGAGLMQGHLRRVRPDEVDRIEIVTLHSMRAFPVR